MEGARAHLAEERLDIDRRLAAVSFGVAPGVPPLSDALLDQVLQRQVAELQVLSDQDPDDAAASSGGMLELKPGLWGVSVDIKAAWRRLASWWRRRGDAARGAL